MYALADLTAKKMEGKLASRSKMCVGRFQQPKTEKAQPKEGKWTFKKPKQEKPDTQDEPVLCFNEDSFRQSLEMCQPSAGWLLNFAEEKDIEQPVRKHIDIDHCCHDAVNLSSMTQCFEIERTFSKEDVKYLERMTVGQVENVIWVERDLHDLPHQSLVMCSVWKKCL